MADLQNIREALADNLEAVTDVQWSPYILSNPTPPSGMVGLFSVPAPHETTMQRGVQEVEVALRVVVSTSTSEAAQKQLDAFTVGPKSVKANLESDRTLGGAVDDLHVRDMSAAQFVEANTLYLGAEWTVRILVPTPDT